MHVMPPRPAALAAAAALALLIAACGSSARSSTPSASSSPSSPAPTAAPDPKTTTAGGGLPHPDHIVVVIEENKAGSAIRHNADAPYINHLADGGAVLNDSRAVTHPSEPNYLALFSGSTHGLTDDSCPPTGSPYTTPNLARSLLDGGKTFAGYSEDLPAQGSDACTAGHYARKHNPWSSFSNVPTSVNETLDALPTDFANLPTVSFVVPNLQNDMHDGSVAQGDAWLKAHLDAYATWAASHNSLLIVTFDEDDNTADNRILTIVSGSGVTTGASDQRVDHYSVLRTITDLTGVTAPGQAATATPITGIWAG